MPGAAAVVFAFDQTWEIPISAAQLQACIAATSLTGKSAPATLVGAVFSTPLSGKR